MAQYLPGAWLTKPMWPLLYTNSTAFHFPTLAFKSPITCNNNCSRRNQVYWWHILLLGVLAKGKRNYNGEAFQEFCEFTGLTMANSLLKHASMMTWQGCISPWSRWRWWMDGGLSQFTIKLTTMLSPRTMSVQWRIPRLGQIVAYKVTVIMNLISPKSIGTAI